MTIPRLVDTGAGPEDPEKVSSYRLMTKVYELLGMRPLLGRVERIMFGPNFLADPASMPRRWGRDVVGAHNDQGGGRDPGELVSDGVTIGGAVDGCLQPRALGGRELIHGWPRRRQSRAASPAHDWRSSPTPATRARSSSPRRSAASSRRSSSSTSRRGHGETPSRGYLSVLRLRGRQPIATIVEEDDARERREPFDEVSGGGKLPQELDVGDEAGTSDRWVQTRLSGAIESEPVAQ